MRNVYLIQRGLIFCVLLALSACGSSGGGTTTVTTPSLMNGVYAFHGYTATNALPGFPFEIGEWGTKTADGAGNLTGITSTNDAAVVTLPAPVPDAIYSVFSDGSWTTRLPDISGPEYEGGISPSGDLVIAGSSRPVGVPGVQFFARVGSGFSLASLTGTWHFASISDGPDAIYGNFVFSGAGVANGNIATTGSAALLPIGPGTYTVAPDGAVTISLPAFPTLLGQIAGDVIVFSGTSLAINLQIAGVAVRAGAGLADAVLDGDYFAVGMQETGTWQSFTGIATADGLGGLNATFLQNDEGLLSIQGPLPATYAVAGDGSMTFTTGTNNIGGVSPDGSVAVVGGGTAGGDDPFFFVLMRR